MLEQIEHCPKRLVVRDQIREIRGKALEIAGDPPLADALGDRCPLGSKLAARIIVEQSGPGRICKSYSDIGVSLVERNADAGQRATGTCSGSQ